MAYAWISLGSRWPNWPSQHMQIAIRIPALERNEKKIKMTRQKTDVTGACSCAGACMREKYGAKSSATDEHNPCRRDVRRERLSISGGQPICLHDGTSAYVRGCQRLLSTCCSQECSHFRASSDALHDNEHEHRGMPQTLLSNDI